jgi:amidase
MRNPVTGPIYVNGARPGDVLAVKLLDIRPKGIGVACCGSWGGQLSCWMDEDSATLRFFDLSRCGTTVTMRDCQNKNNNEDENYEQEAPVSLRGRMLPIQKLQRRLGPIAFPTRPMLGVVGVAPCQQDDPIGTIPAGKHGGNLDNRNNGIGSTIYLPIHHPGGLLSMGDMHASQGDGEISGSGIEIGGDVLLSCEVLKHEDLYDVRLCVDGDAGATNDSGISLKLEYPVTETSTHWVTHGVLECDIPETTSIACQEAAKILIGQWGFTKEEAFVFLSVRGDLGLCQACHPDRGTQIAKMSVPKLEGVCPRAFRVLLDSAEENDAPRKRGLRPKDDASAG